jgi:parvulin-like peptidyl-prolyl isomerase
VRNREAALAAKPLVLERLIRNERMLAEALRRGYGETESVRRVLRAHETQLLVPRFLDEVVGAGIEVTAEEIRAFYDENRTEFPKPPKLHLGQVSVAEREEAERLARLLREGADLAWLARQYSIDRFAEGGGDRGWMVATKGVDPIQDAIFDARPGDVLGPMGAPGNFVVLRVDAREDQGYRTLEEVSGTIRSAVYMSKFEEALDGVVRTLRSRSEIRIDEERLGSLEITASPSEPGGENAAPPPTHGSR